MQSSLSKPVPPKQRYRILCAEDDEDDRILLRAAIEQSGREVDLQFVDDGNQLLQYLRRQGPYATLPRQGACKLVLLDLNMPVQDGRMTLLELKRDPQLRQLPIVVLTSSSDMDHIREIYELGANSFVVKPESFASFVSMVDSLIGYWFDLARLPSL